MKLSDGLYSFVQNTQRYVVDLEGGQFFPIDEVVWDILQVCPAPSLNALLDSLKDRYPERTVLEGLWKLSRFAQLGYLVDGELFRPLVPPNRDRCRLFWMQDFLYLNLPYREPAVTWTHFQLLRTLAQHVDLHIGVPEEDQDRFDWLAEHIHKVPMYKGRKYSPVRYVTDDYDGILALSPGYADELPFFYAPCPVLARVNSEISDLEREINGVLAKYGVLRRQDALIADASWVVEGYARLVGSHEGFEVIPDGIDEIDMPEWQGPINPIAKRPDDVKAFFAEHIGWVDCDSRPTVGLIFGTPLEDYLPIALRMSRCRPDWNFLILGETVGLSITQLPENLRFWRPYQSDTNSALEDIYIVFKGIDVLFFNAVLGSPPSWLWRGMAAGVPLVTSSYTPIPEVEGASRFIAVERLGNYRTHIPIEAVMGEIDNLLCYPQVRMELSAAGSKAAKGFTWANTTEQFLSMLDERQQWAKEFQSQQDDFHFPCLFVRQYDKAREKTTSQTLRFPSSTPESLESGLIRELSREHNDREVQGILNALGKLKGIKDK